MSERKFPWGLLQRVSRSFFLTLKLLPRGVREPVSLAYLLARLSDTEADGAETEAEYELLAKRSEILGLLEGAPMRVSIERVWATIREGQRFDEERFASPDAPPLLPAELDRYTYLVAGCVGEFWTHVCATMLPGFSRKPQGEMIDLGIRYGKALQLVNILRDRVADMQRGRVYVAEQDYAQVVTQARVHLQAGRAYCAALRPIRLHAATLLPCLLAAKTLDLLLARPTGEHVKVTRGQVRASLLQAFGEALSCRLARVPNHLPRTAETARE